MDTRLLVSIWGGKLSSFAIRALGRGAGLTFPGSAARRIDPLVLRKLSGLVPRGSVLISGTNGKTTTAKMIATVLRDCGLRVVHNRSGANLLSGVTHAFVEMSDMLGRLKADVALLEVDEGAFPLVAAEVAPRIVIVTNFFRDQLDRYGELDKTVSVARGALASLSSASTVFLNADDPLVAGMGKGIGARVRYFGLETAGTATVEPLAASDANYCSNCGSAFVYDALFYGHLGKYACRSCGTARPPLDLRVTGLDGRGMRGSVLRIAHSGGEMKVGMRIPGIYNAYNALAAAGCCLELGVDQERIRHSLEGFSSAFGRMERIQAEEKELFLILVKNPTGFNEVLRTLFADRSRKNLLILLNDNIADGQDISWVWDVDFELVSRRQDEVVFCVTSGTRAEDMACRLKYAGLDTRKITIERDMRRAMARCLERMANGETLYVLPTYTAMLGIRDVIRKMGYAKRYWEAG